MPDAPFTAHHVPQEARPGRGRLVLPLDHEATDDGSHGLPHGLPHATEVERRAQYAAFRAGLHAVEQRHRAAHDPSQPGYLARLAHDLLNPSRRILAALDHAERHGDSLFEGLWSFQPFAMRVGDLLISALAGCDPQALATWQSRPPVTARHLPDTPDAVDPSASRWARAQGPLTRVAHWRLTRVPRRQVELALAHAERFGQTKDGLWVFQPFALNVGELLLAALRAG